MVLSIIIRLIIVLGGIVGRILGMRRLVVVEGIGFKKVFCDLILINSVRVGMLVVCMIVLVMEG